MPHKVRNPRRTAGIIRSVAVLSRPRLENPKGWAGCPSLQPRWIGVKTFRTIKPIEMDGLIQNDQACISAGGTYYGLRFWSPEWFWSNGTAVSLEAGDLQCSGKVQTEKSAINKHKHNKHVDFQATCAVLFCLNKKQIEIDIRILNMCSDQQKTCSFFFSSQRPRPRCRPPFPPGEGAAAVEIFVSGIWGRSP